MSVYTELNKIRKDSLPYLIQINTWRYLEHCGPNYDDDLDYRKKNDTNYWIKKDQIKIYEKKLKQHSIINEYDLIKIKKKLQNEINNAFQFAKKSNFPKKNNLKKYIYSQ